MDFVLAEYETACNERDALENEKSDLEASLVRARSEKEMRDLKARLKTVNFKHQASVRKVADIRRKARQNRGANLDRLFKEVAREKLSVDVFREICVEAGRRYEGSAEVKF